MIKTEAWSGGTDEEYETQHFGFGSQRFKIAVRQMVEQKITNGVMDMESYLQESLQLNETDKATLTRCFNKLISVYCEKAEPCLKAVDAEIEKILQIPQNVLLPGDECQAEVVTDSEYEELKDEVAALRKRVERGAIMEALLGAEESELAMLKNVCETAKKDMEVFDLLSSESNIKSAVADTVFLCESANMELKSNCNVDVFD